MELTDALLALVVIVATAVGSFGGLWFGFRLSSDAMEQQFSYARRIEAVAYLTGLLHDLHGDFLKRASRDVFRAKDKERRAAVVGAKLSQLLSYRLIYSPWLTRSAFDKLAKLNLEFKRRHVSFSNAVIWNTVNDPDDPRCVEALDEMERRLRDEMPTALEEVKAEFRDLIGAKDEVVGKRTR